MLLKPSALIAAPLSLALLAGCAAHDEEKLAEAPILYVYDVEVAQMPRETDVRRDGQSEYERQLPQRQLGRQQQGQIAGVRQPPQAGQTELASRRAASALSDDDQTVYIESSKRQRISLAPGEQVEITLVGSQLDEIRSAEVMAGGVPVEGVRAQLREGSPTRRELVIRADEGLSTQAPLRLVLRGAEGMVPAPVRLSTERSSSEMQQQERAAYRRRSPAQSSRWEGYREPVAGGSLLTVPQ